MSLAVSPLGFILQRYSAYLLVFHGSRDRRPQKAAEQLAALFSQRIQHSNERVTVGSPIADFWSPLATENGDLVGSGAKGKATVTETSALVEVAALEGAPTPLHDQIVAFGHKLHDSIPNAAQPETGQIMVLPLFLLPGVHVMEDIPAQVAIAQQALEHTARIQVCAHLGSHTGLSRLITERMAALPVEAWILLAHGSRRPGANQTTEALAQRLGAVTAYWSTPPDLEFRLSELMHLGLRQIAILPYFLFSGSTTDAIAQRVTHLSQQFPTLNLHLTHPFDNLPELADLLVDLAKETAARVKS